MQRGDAERAACVARLRGGLEYGFDVGAPTPATEVPLLAARIRGRSAVVFVVENGVAKKRTVEVLGERGGSLFVARELAPGALVVTQGRASLADDDRVSAKLENAKPEPTP